MRVIEATLGNTCDPRAGGSLISNDFRHGSAHCTSSLPCPYVGHSHCIVQPPFSCAAIDQVMPDMLQVLQSLLQLRPEQPLGRLQLHAMLDRALVKLARTLVGTQEAHPWYVPRYCSATCTTFC